MSFPSRETNVQNWYLLSRTGIPPFLPFNLSNLMWKECIGAVVPEKEGVVHGVKYVIILNSENHELLLPVSLIDLSLLHSTPSRKQSASEDMLSVSSFR